MNAAREAQAPVNGGLLDVTSVCVAPHWQYHCTSAKFRV